MTELEKDCEKIARCDGIFLPKFVAARLAELGYVKVVRCGECKHWKHIGFDVHICGRPGGEGRRRRYYCSAGERVVAKDATGEEAGE